MGKHRDKGQPSTGTGQAGGHGAKPAKGQVSITSRGGAVLWKATASLFSKGRKK